MAETARSLLEHRDTHGEGEGAKPTPSTRGRGCGRKRKGTPVKVFVTHTEEDGVPEHNLSSGDRKDGSENKRSTQDRSVCNTESAPRSCGPSELTQDKVPALSKTSSTPALSPAASSVRTPTPVPAPAPATAAPAQAVSLSPASTAPAAPAASAPASAAMPYPPSPNCRIREVHCGSQVRLVVIAIRDITKGEEITVDYSLIEWGENLGFRATVSAAQQECNSDSDNIKKEDEPLSLTSQQQQRRQQQQQEFVTPSWSLSPSSSPISHSDASDSDAGDEDNSSRRGRAPRRRKKRRGAPLKKKPPHRTPPGRSPPVSSSIVSHLNRPLASPQSFPPCSSSSSSTSSKPEFKPPTPLGPSVAGNASADVPKGGGASVESTRQTCQHCGRHFRSLGRHLDKHHSHQPDVCSALVERYTQMPHLHAQSTTTATAPPHTQQRSKLSHARGVSLCSDPAQSGVQDLSMSLPTLTAANQSHISSGGSATPPVLTPPHGQNAVAVSVLKRGPPPVSATQFRKGATRRLKKEKQMKEEEDEVEEEEVEVVAVKKPKEEEDLELGCPQSFSCKTAKEMKEEEVEEEEEKGEMELGDESGAEEKEKENA
ncbi:serine/arginine repetitive matrix protein 1, partial [Nematolebias whitei]|uniref:serine/arginine repetitive matrix protein 1 n=1 Tax=Nematolebias whitei TaxID=451745 RepID=UPI001897C4BF